MPNTINPRWIKKMEDNIYGLDEVVSYRPAIQWLIRKLVRMDVPYKVHNMGEGVKRIVTKDVDTCPCCKRRLP